MHSSGVGILTRIYVSGAGAGNQTANETAETAAQQQSAAAVCGDGVVNGNEQCDGSSLNGQTCASLGYSGGTLSCSSSCTFNTAGCTSQEAGPIITIPPETASILYVVVAIIAVIILGYWHYHHRPHKNKLVYRTTSVLRMLNRI